MKPGTPWKNGTAVVSGLYAALAPIWTPMQSMAAMALICGGLLIVVAGIFALATPLILIMDWIQAVMGSILFISPWPMLYYQNTGAALTAWITGIVAASMGAWAAVSVSRRRGGAVQSAKKTLGGG